MCSIQKEKILDVQKTLKYISDESLKCYKQFEKWPKKKSVIYNLLHLNC